MAEAANSDGLLIDLKLMRFRVTDELAEGTVDSDGAIILPSSEVCHRYILLQLRNFSDLAQVAELELAAPDK